MLESFVIWSLKLNLRIRTGFTENPAAWATKSAIENEFQVVENVCRLHQKGVTRRGWPRREPIPFFGMMTGGHLLILTVSLSSRVVTASQRSPRTVARPTESYRVARRFADVGSRPAMKISARVGGECLQIPCKDGNRRTWPLETWWHAHQLTAESMQRARHSSLKTEWSAYKPRRLKKGSVKLALG